MGLVVKAQRVLHNVVEGKVHVVGMVREDSLQMVLDGRSNSCQFYLRRELGLQFRGKVGHKTKLVIDLMIGLTVCKVLVHQGAARESRRHDR